jgi:uncharacterized protein (TIGR02599 family)
MMLSPQLITPLQAPRVLRQRVAGFSLVELLVGVAIFAMLLIAMGQMVASVQRTYVRTKAKTEQYRGARIAMETIARRISQATLNSYWDYDYYPGTQQPKEYVRNSELHFTSGPAHRLLPATAKPVGHAAFFHSPFGVDEGAGTEAMHDLLNGWGYYVTFDSDKERLPGFMAKDPKRFPLRYRFRLMEFREPSNEIHIFQPTPSSTGIGTLALIQTQTTQDAINSWFGASLASNSEPLADNILSIIIQPLRPTRSPTDIATDIAPDYLYDSRRFKWAAPNDALASRTRHQLPPSVLLSVIAVDESSWSRLPLNTATALAERLRTLLGRTLFVSSGKLPQDFQTLQVELNKEKVDYRVFSTQVPLRAARWSAAASETADPTSSQ